MGPAEKAFRYRSYAQELKVKIRKMRDRRCAKILENIAADYDRLAAIQEQLSKSDQRPINFKLTIV
jgi:uncharacterized membrane protein (DUF106 family)